jgi:uncharacterized membrane protein
MAESKPKPGHYLIGSAMLWAAGSWAGSWFITPEASFFKVISAAAGGIAAGWSTALILGRLAKWGVGAKVLMVLGLVLGIAFASGAVAGLNYAISHYRAEAVQVNWELLLDFLTKATVIPAAVLGILTGLYVRSSVPRPAKKKD